MGIQTYIMRYRMDSIYEAVLICHMKTWVWVEITERRVIDICS